jgi:hypothetical protein
MPSSVIHGMMYDPGGQSLVIVFRGARGSYRYFDVTDEEWMAFKRSPSKGTYLNSIFKRRQHRCERLPGGLRGRLSASLATASVTGAGGSSANDVADVNIWGFYENSL